MIMIRKLVCDTDKKKHLTRLFNSMLNSIGPVNDMDFLCVNISEKCTCLQYTEEIRELCTPEKYYELMVEDTLKMLMQEYKITWLSFVIIDESYDDLKDVYIYTVGKKVFLIDKYTD